mgnify:CR=1 FL=1
MIRPVPGVALNDQPERVLTRICAWAEAQGEPAYGVIAVLCVIARRAKTKNQPIRDVILAHKQFSWTLDPDYIRRAMAAHYKEAESWSRIDALVEAWEQGVTTDPSGGADHYYNPAVAKPVWGLGHPQWKSTVTIGHHLFGNCP